VRFELTLLKKYGLIYEVVMRDMKVKYESDILTNNWKEFFNEVAARCEYWELGFGDINAEKESELVRECFVDKYTVQHTVDAWHEYVVEEMVDNL